MAAGNGGPVNPRRLRSRICEQAAREGRQLLYVHPVVYPSIEVHVQLLEKSRDQMADVERAVLGLCALGVGLPVEIAFAMGLMRHRLASLLVEIEHRGLIARAASDAPYALTELGRMSHEQGAECLRSTRAVLLCGITGQLLPAGAYEAVQLAPDELRGWYRDRAAIAASSAVPLRHLDLAHVPDKRAVNLPDEVTAIEGIVADSVRPCFIDALLEVGADVGGAAHCRVYFGSAREFAGWLTLEQALGLLEPFGYPSYAPEQLLALMCEDLQAHGAQNVRARFDPYGNPELEIGHADERFYSYRADDQPLVLHLGTDTLAPVPLARYVLAHPRGRGGDVLRGRALRVRAQPGSALQHDVQVMRLVYAADVEGRRALESERARARRVHAALERAGVLLERARNLVACTGCRDLLALL